MSQESKGSGEVPNNPAPGGRSAAAKNKNRPRTKQEKTPEQEAWLNLRAATLKITEADGLRATLVRANMFLGCSAFV
jgi:hypothetical protein